MSKKKQMELPILSPESWLDQIRVDRKIFSNLANKLENFEDDQALVMDFIVFFAHNFKQDLFGYTSFSVADFCRIMKYHKQHLQKLHPEISKGYRKAPSISGLEMKSIFDYTIYRLSVQKLVFSKRQRKNLTTDTIKANLISVINDLEISVDRKKTDRRIYTIRLDEEFINSILKNYISIPLQQYTSLSSAREKSLYWYLIMEKARLEFEKKNSLTPYFEHICSITGIVDTIQEPKHKKEALTRMLESIKKKTELQFEYKFSVTDKQTYAYSIELSFTDLQEKNLVKSNSFPHLDFFFNRTVENMKLHFGKLYPEYEAKPDYFQKWLSNKTANADLKAKIIQEAYKSTYMYYKLSENEKQELINAYKGYLIKINYYVEEKKF